MIQWVRGYFADWRDGLARRNERDRMWLAEYPYRARTLNGRWTELTMILRDMMIAVLDGVLGEGEGDE